MFRALTRSTTQIVTCAAEPGPRLKPRQRAERSKGLSDRQPYMSGFDFAITPACSLACNPCESGFSNRSYLRLHPFPIISDIWHASSGPIVIRLIASANTHCQTCVSTKFGILLSVSTFRKHRSPVNMNTFIDWRLSVILLV